MVFKVKCIYERYEFEPEFGFVKKGTGTELKVTAAENKLTEIGEEEFVIRYAPVLSTGTYGILVTNLATMTEPFAQHAFVEKDELILTGTGPEPTEGQEMTKIGEKEFVVRYAPSIRSPALKGQS